MNTFLPLHRVGPIWGRSRSAIPSSSAAHRAAGRADLRSASCLHLVCGEQGRAPRGSCAAWVLCLGLLATVLPGWAATLTGAGGVANGTIGGGDRFVVMDVVGSVNVANLAPTVVAAVASGPLSALTLVGALPTETPPPPGVEAVEVEVTVTHAVVFNPQTSAFEVKVSLRNTWPGRIGGLMIFPEGLPSGVRLTQNMAGTSEPPYVRFSHTVARGETMSAVLEFFVPSRNPAALANLTFYAVASERLKPEAPQTAQTAGTPATRYLQLANGSFLVEFPSTAGRRYVVQYADAVATPMQWETAEGLLTASGATTVWLDNGAPKTRRHPITGGSRYYRILGLSN